MFNVKIEAFHIIWKFKLRLLRYAMVYLISINYKWLLTVDQAFCKSYTCINRYGNTIKMAVMHIYGGKSEKKNKKKRNIKNS